MKYHKYVKKKETNLTQTPHNGYHWHIDNSRFFEGWCFRITLPKIRESFAFIYSIKPI